MVSRSTSEDRTSAATKFRSFSRKAQSLATHRSSLSRHQPVYRGSPSGAAVLAFWTLTSLLRQPAGRADVLRSTPPMLNPWSSSNGENSPATPSMRSGRSQADREPAVEPPGPPLGTGEFRDDG